MKVKDIRPGMVFYHPTGCCVIVVALCPAHERDSIKIITLRAQNNYPAAINDFVYYKDDDVYGFDWELTHSWCANSKRA